MAGVSCVMLGSFQIEAEPAGPAGRTVYQSVGTYSWIPPEGVTSISVVTIGAGGGGASTNSRWASGGGGGGLGWKNNISISPGDTVEIFVGNGGSPGAAGGSVMNVTVGGQPGGAAHVKINNVIVCIGYGGSGGSNTAVSGGSYTGAGMEAAGGLGLTLLPPVVAVVLVVMQAMEVTGVPVELMVVEVVALAGTT